jgi:PhnB protein
MTMKRETIPFTASFFMDNLFGGRCQKGYIPLPTTQEGGVMTKSKTPEGYSTVIPYLTINGAAEALKLYQQAFGAKEVRRLNSPDGSKVAHACIEIGSSKLFISDVDPQRGGNASSSGFYVYMEDVDNAFRQARKAGLEEVSPPQDMFWGDRTGSLRDKFGLQWTLATRVREVSDDEMKQAIKKMSAKAA